MSTPQLEMLDREKGRLAEIEKQLDTLQKQCRQRESLQNQRKPLATRASELEEAYPVEAHEGIQAEYARVKTKVDEVKSALEDSKRKLSEAEKTMQGHRGEEKKARQAQEEADRELSLKQGAHEREMGEQTARLAALPDAWRVVGVPDAEHLGRWESEVASLDGADVRRHQLEQARVAEQHLAAALARIVATLAQIPTEARRPLAELAQQETEVKGHVKELEAKRSEHEKQKHELENRQAQRARVEAERMEAAHKAKQYGRLATLLGRDYLQRYLLRQAEEQIVAAANEVLDRVSHNTMRLELQASEGEESGAKALDLVGYNSEVGEKPLPVYAFSGSQRFRIAVSLALALGQHASQRAASIEAVIIDEGFGGLDQQGRREMIEQLHELQGVLKRIILVSHQQEFTRAFPKRYHIVMDNQSSKAVLAEGEETEGFSWQEDEV